MKLSGNVEVNGIDRVVFYKKNIFMRVNRPNGTTYWYDMIRQKTLDNETMCSIVKKATQNPMRKVWIHGGSINVDRVDKNVMKKLRADALKHRCICLTEALDELRVHRSTPIILR